MLAKPFSGADLDRAIQQTLARLGQGSAPNGKNQSPG
jgi:hypothetical protein